MGLALIATLFCFFPTGIIALVKSSEVSCSTYYRGISDINYTPLISLSSAYFPNIVVVVVVVVVVVD